MPMHRAVNKDFFKKWTPEMAYVLGFFAADGYMTFNKRGAQFWNIQIKDKAILTSIKSAIKAEHKISVRIRKGNWEPIYRLQIGSKDMCSDLVKLGFIPRKTRCLTIPDMPKKYFSHFVRGYFDGDGNVWIGYIHKDRKKKTRTIRTVFTSCSTDFLSSIRQKLESFGVLRGVLSKGQGDYFRLTYSVSNSLKLNDFMYNQDIPLKGLFLKRKRDVFEKFIRMRE